MDTQTSSPGSSSEGDDDSDGAVLVLIGFPGSGKSETGNTLTGQRYFKNTRQRSGSKKIQEGKFVFDELHVTVRDMPGFESISEFVDIYNSLTDLECGKVVFGLTIEIGRFPTEYSDMLQRIFQENGIGEHLKRKTFLIFTKVDELLKYGEVSYEGRFEKWLRESEGIDQLITSLKLGYCVIQNKQSGDKQKEHANLVIQQLKCILQNDNAQETWYRRNENMISNVSDVPSCNDGHRNPENENYENPSFDQVMEKELTITVGQAFDEIKNLQRAKYENEKLDIIQQILSNYQIGKTSSNDSIAKKLLREFVAQKESKYEVSKQKNKNRDCPMM